ncbi:MAG: hypothetical protein OHK0023_02520 [Anaerolineae bacterium]
MLDHLIETLRGPEHFTPLVLQYALNGLGKVGNHEHIALIAPFTTSQHERKTRLAAVAALGNLGGDQAADALLKLINDSDIVIRWQAQEALDKLFREQG